MNNLRSPPSPDVFVLMICDIGKSGLHFWIDIRRPLLPAQPCHERASSASNCSIRKPRLPYPNFLMYCIWVF
jgi:hypothetical protein